MRAGSMDQVVRTALQAEYYRVQRASAGLIVAETTAISADGFGYADTPGLWGARGSGARMALGHRRRACRRRPHHRAALAHRRYCPSRRARRFAATVGIRRRPSLRVSDRFGTKAYGRAPTDDDGRDPPKRLPIMRAQVHCNAMEAGFDGLEILAAYLYLIPANS